MPWAQTADHFEIYYGDSGEGQPVIAFQSGYMGIHDIWKFQVEALRGDPVELRSRRGRRKHKRPSFGLARDGRRRDASRSSAGGS